MKEGAQATPARPQVEVGLRSYSASPQRGVQVRQLTSDLKGCEGECTKDEKIGSRVSRACLQLLAAACSCQQIPVVFGLSGFVLLTRARLRALS